MNYNTLQTETLEGLLKIATPENAVKITEILESRKVNAPTQIFPEVKPSERDLATILEKSRINVNHSCQFIPKGSVDYIDGVIRSIFQEDSTHNVFYHIIDSNKFRHTVNVTDKSLYISEEVVPPVPITKIKSEEFENEEWSKEDELNKYSNLIGKLIDKIASPTGEMVSGRIMKLTAHPTTHKVSAKIQLYTFSPNSVKPKLVSIDRTINQSFLNQNIYTDEHTATYRDSYFKREREKRHKGLPNPLQRVEFCRQKLAQAKENMKKAKEVLEARLRALEIAEKEYKNSILK